MGEDDKAMGRVCELLAALSVTLHVRGTDERPVIELCDKRYRTIVGGIELKRRMRRARLSDQQLKDVLNDLSF